MVFQPRYHGNPPRSPPASQSLVHQQISTVQANRTPSPLAATQFIDRGTLFYLPACPTGPTCAWRGLNRPRRKETAKYTDRGNAKRHVSGNLILGLSNALIKDMWSKLCLVSSPQRTVDYCLETKSLRWPKQDRISRQWLSHQVRSNQSITTVTAKYASPGKVV